MKRTITLVCLGLLTVSSIAYAVIAKRDTSASKFVTRDSLEPDTWSSICLITQHIAPHTVIEVRPTGGPFFGIPQAQYK